jgi:hypothetical protein
VICPADLASELGEATGLKNILMCYEKYQTQIVRLHHVQIQGWPTEIPFNVPKIASSSDLRHIRQGLEQGSIRWVKLTREEIKELEATYLENRPETRTRKRKQPTAVKNTRPKKGQRTGGQSIKSAAHIDQSEENQSSEYST